MSFGAWLYTGLVSVLLVPLVGCAQPSDRPAQSSRVAAEARREVPKKLFEVELGKIYELGSSIDEVGSLPVKRITGTQAFLGQGVHLYFQPRVENKAFPYEERPKAPTDKYFETSFRLYILPVIPDSITKSAQLGEGNLKRWEVVLIEWSAKPKDTEKGYLWAFELCKTFAADLGMEPAITDDYSSKDYDCKFAGDTREFSVANRYGQQTVKLSFDSTTTEAKSSSIEKRIRQLEAKEIRPY